LGVPRGNRGFGTASPEQIARYIKLHENLDVTGEITGAIPYVPQGQVNNARLLASNIHDATVNKAKWILDKAEDGTLDYFPARVDRQKAVQPEILYTSGRKGSAGLRAQSALGIDEDPSSPRYAASKVMFDRMLPIIYAKDKPYGMTEAEYGAHLLDYARNRYAYNGEILGKQTHHIWELNEGNKYSDAIDDPAVRTQVLADLLDEGIVGGDFANNFSALYGNIPVGKNVVPADTRPAGNQSNQHQGGVHPESLRLSNEVGLPNSRNTVEEVRVPLPRAVKKRGQAAIDLHNAMVAYDDERRTVEKYMRGKTPEQQAAATKLSAYIGVLANEQAKAGGRLTSKDPGIAELKEKIRTQRAILDSSAVTRAKQNATAFMGMDFEDELLQGYQGPGPEMIY